MTDYKLEYTANRNELRTSSNCAETRNFCREIQKKKSRNLLGFWLLGLCNNFAYVIMLSAAFDVLNPDYHGNDDTKDKNCTSNQTLCNSISTGAILLADILPCLLIKMVAPFIMITTHYRVIIAVTLSSLSFIITAFSKSNWMTFTGVICASLSSGLGEVTFLTYSSFFEKDVVSTWSSGTGGAGVIGALSYASLTHVLSPRKTLQVMLIIPVLMSITFWIVIDHPPSAGVSCKTNFCPSELEPVLHDGVDLSTNEVSYIPKFYTLNEKISLIKPLLKYMVPLGFVYFAEYLINQGLMEILYFSNACSWLSHEDQYRWYQVDYQIGVLISRSSVNLFQIRKLWILPILQFLNLIFLVLQVCFSFIPNIWIVLIIIFYEGLLGGGAYVNTFYRISSEVSEENKEFSMGIASLADSIGIAFAGFASIPIHNALCEVISHYQT